MGEDTLPGLIELVLGGWFILKFLKLNVNFLGDATGIIVCVVLVLVTSLHVSSVKNGRRMDRAGTIVAFSLMVAALSIAYVFAQLSTSPLDVVNNILSLCIGIISVISSLINFSG